MVPQIPLILALDLGAVIQAIIFLVILASGVAKMFRESKEVQRRADQQRPRPRPRPQQGGGDEVVLEAAEAGPRRQAPQENIRTEVEEFLRRVGQEEDPKPARRQPRQRPQESQIEILDDSGFDVDERPHQSRRKPRQTPKPERRAELMNPELESVSDHLAEHLKRGEFEERASHLGEVVAHSDERLEARLHQKFDHRLGSLSAMRQAREAADLAQRDIAAEGNPLTEGLLDMLSTPQGVQQAVILSEVLGRPTDRW